MSACLHVIGQKRNPGLIFGYPAKLMHQKSKPLFNFWSGFFILSICTLSSVFSGNSIKISAAIPLTVYHLWPRRSTQTRCYFYVCSALYVLFSQISRRDSIAQHAHQVRDYFYRFNDFRHSYLDAEQCWCSLCCRYLVFVSGNCIQPN